MTTDLAVRQLASGVIVGERVGQMITHAELCAAAGVNPAEWESVHVNTWTTSFRDKETGEIIQVLNTQRKIRPVRTVAALELESIKDDLVKAVEKVQLPVAGNRPRLNARGLLYEIDVFDAHLAKLAWAEETGTDYDLHIARELLSEALTLLLDAVRDQTPEIQRILLPIGQDLFHVDTSNNTTTAGTPQDVDTRWQKAFLVARDLLVGAVNRMLDVAPVDVVVVPGNHDTQRTWYLGEVLSAYFSGNPNVTVDNSPRSRKYYRYGCVLLGFAHGKDEKPGRLATLMAQDRPQDWAETWWREWHLGHLHHEKSREEMGVRIVHLPSIAGTDAWHYQKTFVHSMRGARGFLWDPEYGLLATHFYNIRPERAQ